MTNGRNWRTIVPEPWLRSRKSSVLPGSGNCRVSEAMDKSARTDTERFWLKSRFEIRRNTLCISRFANRWVGAKDPEAVADDLVNVSVQRKGLSPKIVLMPNEAVWACAEYAQDCHCADAMECRPGIHSNFVSLCLKTWGFYFDTERTRL